QSNLPRLGRERSDGARARPGSVPLPGTAEPEGTGEARGRCPATTDPSWRGCASGSPTPRSSFDLAGKERELAGLREQTSAPNLWDEPERARRGMRRVGRRGGGGRGGGRR